MLNLLALVALPLALADDTLDDRVATTIADHGAAARVAFTTTDAGVVTLMGSMDDPAREAALLDQVGSLPGVVRLRDQIDTPQPQANVLSFSTEQPDRPERVDTETALAMLRTDPRFDADAIRVVGDGDTLVLVGHVSSKRKRRLAERRLSDLAPVRNQLEVVEPDALDVGER
jgi:osmotically-inducible protein OsmY